MKKIILFGLSALAVVLSACNKMDQPAGVKTITMKAEVASEEDTKAIFEADGTKFKFNWESGDVVIADKTDAWFKSTKNDFVTFTYDKSKDEFTGTRSKSDIGETKGEWTAFYPNCTYDNQKLTLSLINQAGTLESAADLYAMKGVATFGSGATYMKFEMKPAVAIIKLTTTYIGTGLLAGVLGGTYSKPTGQMICGIESTASSGTWTAKTVSSGSDISPYKLSGTLYAGTYYFVVPAGVTFALYRNNATESNIIMKTTKGLTAGKYYEVTYPKPTN